MKKIITWLKSHPITSISILIMFLVFGYFLLFKNKTPEEKISINASPLPKVERGVLDRLKDIASKKGATPTPLVYPSSSPLPTGRNVFLVPPSFFPEPGQVELGNTTNSLSLFFETDILLSSVKVESSPFFEFDIKKLPDFKNRIILSPKTKWKSGITYRIKILKGLKSLDGMSSLDKDLNVEYKILPIKPPVYTQPS